MDPYRDPYREADAADPYAQPGHFEDEQFAHDEHPEPEEPEHESDGPGFKAPQIQCTTCTEPIVDYYYRSAGHRFCYDCASTIQVRLTGGSPARRFARASFLGILAGIAGCVIYYVIREATGREFAIVSIGVGYLIGTAVARGADHRGGWLYQLLAVFLTYTAIVLTNVPQIIQFFNQNQGALAPQRAGKLGPQLNGGAAGPGAAQPAPGAPAAPRAFAVPAGGPVKKAAMLVLVLVAAIAVLMITAYVLPIVVGFHSPIIFLIIGVALYEAWALNKRHSITLEGPFAIDPTAGPSPQEPMPSPA